MAEPGAGTPLTRRMADLLENITTELHPGVTHDFIELGRVVPEDDAAQAAIGAALHAAFDNPTA